VCADPGIAIDKQGPATAYVGDRATFTYTVRNTGDVKLSSPGVSDGKCAPVSKVPGGQSSFDPGDVWTHTCTTTITGAMGDELVNVGTACAEWANPDGPDPEVCDEDTHTKEIPKPAILLEKTGAATAAAGSTYTYSFTATNTGNVALGDVVLSDPRCTDTLKRVAPGLDDATFDPGDAWRHAFRARVSAREITSVTFTLDGRVLTRIKGKRASYSVRVQPNRYGFGRRKLVARVTFTDASGTRARKLPLTFRRCAQGLVAPRFTG
jgi:hypothetical protein